MDMDLQILSLAWVCEPNPKLPQVLNADYLLRQVRVHACHFTLPENRHHRKLISRTMQSLDHVMHLIYPTGSHVQLSDCCTHLCPTLLLLSYRKHVTVPFLQHNLGVVVSLSISAPTFICLVSSLNLVDELVPLVSGRDSEENVIKFFKVWNACHWVT